jgi:hypothetical protein
VSVSRAQAVKALRDNDNDIVNAIMELTMWLIDTIENIFLFYEGS